jgi:hypothetical protein
MGSGAVWKDAGFGRLRDRTIPRLQRCTGDLAFPHHYYNMRAQGARRLLEAKANSIAKMNALTRRPASLHSPRPSRAKGGIARQPLPTRVAAARFRDPASRRSDWSTGSARPLCGCRYLRRLIDVITGDRAGLAKCAR